MLGTILMLGGVTVMLLAMAIVMVIDYKKTRLAHADQRLADQQAVRIAKLIRRARNDRDIVFLHTLVLGLPLAAKEVKETLDEHEAVQEKKRDTVAKLLGGSGGET